MSGQRMGKGTAALTDNCTLSQLASHSIHARALVAPLQPHTVTGSALGECRLGGLGHLCKRRRAVADTLPVGIRDATPPCCGVPCCAGDKCKESNSSAISDVSDVGDAGCPGPCTPRSRLPSRQDPKSAPPSALARAALCSPASPSSSSSTCSSVSATGLQTPRRIDGRPKMACKAWRGWEGRRQVHKSAVHTPRWHGWIVRLPRIRSGRDPDTPAHLQLVKLALLQH